MLLGFRKQVTSKQIISNTFLFFLPLHFPSPPSPCTTYIKSKKALKETQDLTKYTWRKWCAILSFGFKKINKQLWGECLFHDLRVFFPFQGNVSGIAPLQFPALSSQSSSISSNHPVSLESTTASLGHRTLNRMQKQIKQKTDCWYLSTGKIFFQILLL